ncbi:hypothetical protein K8942_01760 [Candidatus Peribacteria bacterium]|nr:MAG: hypothetical protein K8942_01760 [Candidatus Peribacteria bacterium]
MNFPRGSEWRKWDLHVHTPASILENGFGEDWDGYVKNLFLSAIQKNIAVIGVTDYFYIEGFKKIKSYTQSDSEMERIFGDDQLLIQKIREIKLFPNIEFRLFPINGQRLNFHVIFSDSVSVENIEENFLHNLNFVSESDPSGGDEKRKLKKINLEELGRKLRDEHEPFRDRSNLHIGMMNAVVNDGEIVDELKNNKVFSGKYILTIPCDEDLSKISWNGQDHNTRKKMIQKSHFLLSSNASTIQWGLGLKHSSKEEFAKEFKTIKPCIWGSDAHKNETLFEPAEQRYTWIKADPTFAGLKQVLNEPDRVFIGAESPNVKSDHQIINNIIVKNSNGWFQEDFKIDINSDLIAIIGGRGSGKSALLEMIALAGGVKDTSSNAFLDKAKRHIDSIEGTSIELQWKGGNITKAIVGGDMPQEELLQFLPQQFVEKICSPDSDGDLLRQIEDVIFQALDETEKQGASDFESLLSKLLIRFEIQKEERIQEIRSINKKVYELKASINEVPQKQKTILNKEAELRQLKETLPKLSIEDKKDQDTLVKLNTLKDIIEAKIIEIKDSEIRIPEIETRLSILKENIDKQITDINALLDYIGIEKENIISFILDDQKLNQALAKKKGDLALQIQTLKSGEEAAVKKILGLEEIISPNLDIVKNTIEEIVNKTKAHETAKLKYQFQMKEIEKIDKEILLLKAEIELTKTTKQKEYDELSAKRVIIFSSFFQLLIEEKKEIEKLYLPLQHSLDISSSDADRSLHFEAKIIYEVDKHWQDGLDLIDRTKKGRFRSPENLKEALNEFWLKISSPNFVELSVKQGIYDLIKKFLTVSEGGKEVDLSIEDQLRQNHSLEHFANWILDVNRYKVISSLKFDGTELTLLSPGQKGIVLLILYLHIDKSDTRPLLVDQPEDNLDNLSVYVDLIEYFKERKLNRQIIIATHNPNLVVNTDAEQICISNYEGGNKPRINYQTGSLENCANPNLDGEAFTDGIIENVCKILEGGTAAFSSRRKKYQLSPREI